MRPSSEAIRHFVSLGSIAAVAATATATTTATATVPNAAAVTGVAAAAAAAATVGGTPPATGSIVARLGHHQRWQETSTLTTTTTTTTRNNEGVDFIGSNINNDGDDEASGVLRNRSNANINSNINRNGSDTNLERCDPDLGVLSCKAGEWCVAVNNNNNNNNNEHNSNHGALSYDDEHSHSHSYWYCVSDGEETAFDTATALDRRNLQTPSTSTSTPTKLLMPNQFQNLPAPDDNDGIYDYCKSTFTYDKDSSPDNPTSYDICICLGYQFVLPRPRYEKRDYCNPKIVPNYCNRYFPTPDNASSEQRRRSKLEYDSCACIVSVNGAHPTEDDVLFCETLPVTYCQKYFPDQTDASEVWSQNSCMCTVFGKFCPGTESVEEFESVLLGTNPPTNAPTESTTSVTTEAATGTTTGEITDPPVPAPTDAPTLARVVVVDTTLPTMSGTETTSSKGSSVDNGSDNGNDNDNGEDPNEMDFQDTIGYHPVNHRAPVKEEITSTSTSTKTSSAPLSTSYSAQWQLVLPTTVAVLLMAWNVGGDFIGC